jgi:hypothetical protein
LPSASSSHLFRRWLGARSLPRSPRTWGKPTRTKVAKANHLGFEGIIDIFKIPQYALDVDAEDYMTNGKFNNRQPGETISRADVANYIPDVRCGFPDSGYFVFESVVTRRH